ncbi:hypothetical protein BC628DRAFT_1316347, partial [Trametes gibbosa]
MVRDRTSVFLSTPPHFHTLSPDVPHPQRPSSNSIPSSTQTPGGNVSISRRSGNANHPAHKPRHAVFLPETQDPDVREAVQLFHGKAFQTINYSLDLSKRKAAKRNPSLRKNVSYHSSVTLQRRRTTEDIQSPSTRLHTTVPQSHSAGFHVPSTSTHHPVPRDNMSLVAGPSKVIIKRRSLTSFANTAADDDDDEDMSFPSST